MFSKCFHTRVSFQKTFLNEIIYIWHESIQLNYYTGNSKVNLQFAWKSKMAAIVTWQKVKYYLTKCQLTVVQLCTGSKWVNMDLVITIPTSCEVCGVIHFLGPQWEFFGRTSWHQDHISAEEYCEMQNKLQRLIKKNKRRRMLTKGIFLLHNKWLTKGLKMDGLKKMAG